MAKFEIQTVFKVEGVADLTRALKDVSKAGEDLKKSFNDFGNAVGNSITKIGQISAAIAGAGAAVVGLTIKNAKANEQLSELSQATGVSTDKLQKLAIIGDQVGFSQETLASGLKKFSVELAKAKTDTTDYTKEAKQLGDAVEKGNEAIRAADKAYNKAMAALSRVKVTTKNQAQLLERGRLIQERHNDAVAKAQGNYDKLKEKLEEAGAENGGFAKTLAKINPKLLEQAKNAKTVDEAFDIYTNALRKTTDEGERNLLFSIAFGKANISLAQISRASAKDIADLNAKIEKYGLVIDKSVIEKGADVADTVGLIKIIMESTSRQLTGTLQPALLQAGNAFAEFIGTNKKQLIELAEQGVKRVSTVVTDLFKLFSAAGPGKNIDPIAQKIFNLFKVMQSAFDLVVPPLKILFEQFDRLAKIIGFASGQQAAFVLIGLRLTGLLTVLTTGFSLIINSLRLFGTLLGAIRPLLVVLTGPAGLLAAALAAIGTAIFFVIDKTIGWDAVNKTILSFFKELGELAPLILEEIVVLLGDLATAAIDFLTKIPAFVRESLGPEVIVALTDMWEQLKILFNDSVLFIQTLLSDIFNNQIVQDIIAGATTIFNFLRENFSSIAVFAAQVFLGAFANLFGTITDFIGKTIATIAELLNGTAASIKATFTGIIDSILAKISGVGAAIAGITGAAAKFVAPVKNVVSNIISSGFGKIKTVFGNLFADGGPVRGPGTSRSDSIPAWLSDGEFVVKADAVKRYGTGFLHALNHGMLNLKGYAAGGLVSMSNSLSGGFPDLSGNEAFSGGLSGRPLTLVLPNGQRVQTRGVEESTAKQLEKELRNSANAKAMNLPTWY